MKKCIASTDWPQWLIKFFEIDHSKYPEKLIVEEKPNFTCEDPLCNQRGCFHGDTKVPCTRYKVFKYTRLQLPWYLKLRLKTLDRISLRLQKFLHKRGIAVHNPIRGECTIDFMCCSKNWKGTKYEHILGSISQAAQNGESTMTIQNNKNPN